VSVIGQLPLREYRVGINTQKVLVVYLNMDNVMMRSQQKKLNLSNISLQRYMKPLYPNKFGFANQSLAKIFLEYNLLLNLSQPVYIVGPVKNNPIIKTSVDYLNEFLGTNLTSKAIIDLFKSLDFKISLKGSELTFLVDPNRIDLEGVNDLAEEVARLYGYDKIPTTPLTIIANEGQNNFSLKLQNKLVNYLIGMGFTNLKTYSLISSQTNQD
jgi:phenylalanyl-tRNA synthetase beta chain